MCTYRRWCQWCDGAGAACGDPVPPAGARAPPGPPAGLAGGPPRCRLTRTLPRWLLRLLPLGLPLLQNNMPQISAGIALILKLTKIK